MRFPPLRFTAAAATRPSWPPATPEGKEGLMLILTRKIDQGIVISGDIHIRVLGVERDRVKIGIAAPRGVVVLRDEAVDGEQEPRPRASTPWPRRQTPAGPTKCTLRLGTTSSAVTGGRIPVRPLAPPT